MRDARHPTSPSAAQGDDDDDGAKPSVTKWKNMPENTPNQYRNAGKTRQLEGKSAALESLGYPKIARPKEITPRSRRT